MENYLTSDRLVFLNFFNIDELNPLKIFLYAIFNEESIYMPISSDNLRLISIKLAKCINTFF